MSESKARQRLYAILRKKAMRRKQMGTLEDRYDNYVKAMTDLGLTYKSFDEWLNS